MIELAQRLAPVLTWGVLIWTAVAFANDFAVAWHASREAYRRRR
jgi:hypothetical protein